MFAAAFVEGRFRLAAGLSLLLFFYATGVAQDALEALKNEPDAGRRSEQALTLAESQFESARAAYAKNDQAAGDTSLDVMAKALDTAVKSLAQARKSRLYKRAELRVAHLQRRMEGLVDDLNLDQRGWAEQTSRHVGEVHEKLLQGAMEK